MCSPFSDPPRRAAAAACRARGAAPRRRRRRARRSGCRPSGCRRDGARRRRRRRGARSSGRRPGSIGIAPAAQIGGHCRLRCRRAIAAGWPDDRRDVAVVHDRQHLERVDADVHVRHRRRRPPDGVAGADGARPEPRARPVRHRSRRSARRGSRRRRPPGPPGRAPAAASRRSRCPRTRAPRSGASRLSGNADPLLGSAPRCRCDCTTVVPVAFADQDRLVQEVDRRLLQVGPRVDDAPRLRLERPRRRALADQRRPASRKSPGRTGARNSTFS